ncbi:hypothetical protein O9K51_09901 [Purpureocillium lavendulum]|uniref:Uncharacterized protein n=1 Tax=Purpureocillium lavendulum TaxID=1247861 RepID=A0AB34FE78_9HYPO|nr:hypothetical protein O9K51_09901 [Purpureocillium lavendulum]
MGSQKRPRSVADEAYRPSVAATKKHCSGAAGKSLSSYSSSDTDSASDPDPGPDSDSTSGSESEFEPESEVDEAEERGPESEPEPKPEPEPQPKSQRKTTKQSKDKSAAQIQPAADVRETSVAAQMPEATPDAPALVRDFLPGELLLPRSEPAKEDATTSSLFSAMGYLTEAIMRAPVQTAAEARAVEAMAAAVATLAIKAATAAAVGRADGISADLK